MFLEKGLAFCDDVIVSGLGGEVFLVFVLDEGDDVVGAGLSGEILEDFWLEIGEYELVFLGEVGRRIFEGAEFFEGSVDVFEEAHRFLEVAEFFLGAGGKINF